MKEYRIDIDPIPAPRMTQRDIWKKRPVVVKYHAYRDAIRYKLLSQGMKKLPSAMGFTFHMPMPKSWTKKRKEYMNGRLHEQKPDLDNLIKAVKDGFTYGTPFDDSHVSCYVFAQKVWSVEGAVVIYEAQQDGRTIIQKIIDYLKNLIE
jgi:Holliday junction resolvase RusA-like endonuclease